MDNFIPKSSNRNTPFEFVLFILFLMLFPGLVLHGFADVDALLEGPDGLIWVANGNQLQKISPDGKTESAGSPVRTEKINAIAGDSNKVLWIGTQEGLFRCEKDSCKIDSRIAGAVRSIAIAPDQSVWIATNKEVLKLQDGSFKVVYTNRVEALAIDKKGSVWLGSGHEIIRWNEPKQVFDLPPPPPNVRMRPPITSILPSSSGKIYVGTHQGLLFLNGKTFKKMSDLEVLALLEDSKENIWIGTTDGLKRMTNGKMIDLELPF